MEEVVKQGPFQNKTGNLEDSTAQYFINVSGSLKLKQWTHNSVKNLENGNRG